MVRNNLQYWRLQYAAKIGQDVNKKDMAAFYHIQYTQYFRYEANPDKYIPSGTTLFDIWQKLRILFPDINMQDLFVQD